MAGNKQGCGAKNSMNVVFMGGKQAGVIGLLTLLAHRERISTVVAYDDIPRHVAEKYHLPVVRSIKKVDWNKPYDLIISVHGREIVPNSMLEMTRLGGINVHPCLYACKGAAPIAQFLKSSVYPRASVGVHWMTEQVDMGAVIKEVFVDVPDCHTEIEVYNTLYPYYATALWDVMESLK